MSVLHKNAEREGETCRLGAAAPAIASAMMGKPSASGPETVVVETRSGRVRGRMEGETLVFRGIPYGADSGGPNRWRPPQPTRPWSGVRDAFHPGPMCPQRPGAPLAEEAAMLQRGPVSEDCLSVNVWTPDTNEGRRPVMVWFHGGGFSAGSGGAAPYDGIRLCAHQDVVLVTVTHRLNLFGFLAAGEGVSNPGLLDCVAALNWVRDNISAFGGDPGCVTIFGQSGGGAKVAALMRMPAAKGLFHRCIVQSAAGLNFATPDAAREVVRAVMGHLGAERLADLYQAPTATLIGALSVPGVSCRPIADGSEIDVQETASDIPLLCGTTLHEATFFPGTPLDPIESGEMRARLAELASGADVEAIIDAVRRHRPDASEVEVVQIAASLVFASPAVRFAERRAAQGRGRVYVYSFEHRVAARGGRLGATHTAEIPYVFNSLARAAPLVGAADAEEQALANRVSALWAGFARRGVAQAEGVQTVEPYDAVRRPTLIIGRDDWRMVDDPLGPARSSLAAP